MNRSPTVDPRQAIVLYDADCGFCRWSLGLLLRADRERRLRPLALGSEQADELLADLQPQQRAGSWHLLMPDGQRESAGAALPRVLELLPRGGTLAALFERFPGATERGYRWVADHRSQLSRLLPSSATRRATALIHARTREAA